MMTHDSALADAHTAAFRAEIQRLRRPRREGTSFDAREKPPGGPAGGPAGGIDLGPASVYEAITRQMVESMRDELREIKSRLNTLLFMMIGAIMVELAMRIIGP